MGLSRTISEINVDFSRKQHIFITPVYITPSLKGLPLELGINARGQNTRMMGLPGLEISFTIFFSRLDTIHERDGRQTDTGRQ